MGGIIMCPASGCKSPWIGSPRSYAGASSYSDVDHCGVSAWFCLICPISAMAGALQSVSNTIGFAKFALEKSNHVGHISSTFFWGRCNVTKGFGFLAQIKRTKWSDSYGRVRGDFQTDKLERGSTWCKTSLLCPEQCHKLATVLLQYLLAIDLYTNYSGRSSRTSVVSVMYRRGCLKWKQQRPMWLEQLYSSKNCQYGNNIMPWVAGNKKGKKTM